MIMEKPRYRNEDWLTEQYVEKEKTLTEIADELGVDHTTISKWRRRLGVAKPKRREVLECPVCESEFTRTKAKIDRAKHANVCSRDCLYKARSRGIIERDVSGGYDTEQTTYGRACPVCNNEFETTANEDHKYCSRDCFLEAHSERMSGAKNPAYVDGSVREKRGDRGPNWTRIRRRVYARDDYTCQRCDVKCISRRDYDGTNGAKLIQAHHITGYEDPSDNNIDDIITLCAKCHGEVEGGESLNVA